MLHLAKGHTFLLPLLEESSGELNLTRARFLGQQLLSPREKEQLYTIIFFGFPVYCVR